MATYSYDPYGNTTASGTAASADPFRFQGGYEDTSGFYKFGTRYENPALGAWTQEDPASVNYLEGYLFSGADPVNEADPSGSYSVSQLLSACGKGAITGLVIGAVGPDETGIGAVLDAATGCTGGALGNAIDQLTGTNLGSTLDTLHSVADLFSNISNLF